MTYFTPSYWEREREREREREIILKATPISSVIIQGHKNGVFGVFKAANQFSSIPTNLFYQNNKRDHN